MTLPEQVLTDEKRPIVVADCVALLERQVAGKKGLSGIAVKSGYSVVRRLRGGTMVPKAVDDLLPEFTDVLETFHSEFREHGSGTFAEFSRGKESVMAEALLAVTDGKAVHAKNRVLKKIYTKLRPSAGRNIATAVPELAALIDKHTA